MTANRDEIAVNEPVIEGRVLPVRYWVLVADELMDQADSPLWPKGLRPVRPDDGLPPNSESRWWLFEDDGAPATLNGKRVELTFVRVGDGDVQIGSRKPAA